MRILILGGDGMLGHQLLVYLRQRHEVKVTLRQNLVTYEKFGYFNRENSYDNIDVRSLERLLEVIIYFKPDVLINAVGIIKQRQAAKESIPSIVVNALLPHRLVILCKGIGARLIHLSTDCIFSGKKGNYQENDAPDAEDLYGRTKFLGEVHDSNCLTLRTSMIGWELSHNNGLGLLEWFLAQRGPVKGFTKAIFTGFTTLELSRIIEMMLVKHPGASGVYQVSSEPISKYDLLLLLREKLGHNIEIIPDSSFYCDRSLDSTRFRTQFGYTPSSWPAMIEELHR